MANFREVGKARTFLVTDSPEGFRYMSPLIGVEVTGHVAMRADGWKRMIDETYSDGPQIRTMISEDDAA